MKSRSFPSKAFDTIFSRQDFHLQGLVYICQILSKYIPKRASNNAIGIDEQNPLVSSKKSNYRPVTCLDVLDGGGGAAGGDGGEDFTVLLNVHERGTGGGVGSAARASSSGAGEGHGSEVCEGNKAVTLLKVFDDPLSVLLAESIAGGEVLGDGLASGQVLNGRYTRGGRVSGDGGLDLVTSRDSDAREVVGVVRVPLVPSCSVNE